MSALRIPNPVFGWSLKPNSVQIRTTEGTIIEVKYNDQGWRDTHHTFENPKDKKRILVLGDSFMEAYSVDINDGLPKQLEVLAEKDGKGLEIINLGVGGYGTLQEYLVYHKVGAKYKPDIVLLGFYLSNDLTNNSATLEKLNRNEKARRRPFLIYEDLPAWNISEVDYNSAMKRYNKALEKKTYTVFRRMAKTICAF